MQKAMIIKTEEDIKELNLLLKNGWATLQLCPLNPAVSTGNLSSHIILNRVEL